MVEEGMKIIKKEENCLNIDVLRHDNTSIKFNESLIKNNFKELNEEDNFFLIDNNVFKIFSNELKDLISKGNYFIVKGGDKNKNIHNLMKIIDTLYEKNISRKGKIVAIGGGVVTDIAGLVANLYFRGINVIHVPTTFLAMIDASIGGKVAVNHPLQKNLIGSFYQPKEIIICRSFLKTLPKEQIESAMGEALKIAIIASESLFEDLENFDYNLEGDKCKKIIKTCVEKKIIILGNNCYERSFERILNFGHSVGHPIEDLSEFRIPHGSAVTMGIAVATAISQNKKQISDESAERIYKTIKKLGLNYFDNSLDIEKLWDKISKLIYQRGGQGLLYVIPTSIGSAKIINNITKEEFTKAIQHINEIDRL